jgi:hypothetical protein
LKQEIERVGPEIIVTVGRFATRHLLGDVDMDSVHGIPHRVDDGRGDSGSIVVIPCYHPAAGFYDDDTRPLIYYDYERVGEICALRKLSSVRGPVDDHPDVAYLDVDWEFDFEEYNGIPVVGFDTEGDSTGYW